MTWHKSKHLKTRQVLEQVRATYDSIHVSVASYLAIQKHNNTQLLPPFKHTQCFHDVVSEPVYSTEVPAASVMTLRHGHTYIHNTIRGPSRSVEIMSLTWAVHLYEHWLYLKWYPIPGWTLMPGFHFYSFSLTHTQTCTKIHNRKADIQKNIQKNEMSTIHKLSKM